MRIQTINDTLEVDNHSDLGKFIVEMISDPDVASNFPKAASPMNGGCLLLANALLECFGRGELYVMVQKGSNRVNKNPVIEHFMLGIELRDKSTLFLDANGAGTSIDITESLATSKYLHGSQLNNPNDFLEFSFEEFEKTFGRYSPHAYQIYPLNEDGRQDRLVSAMKTFIAARETDTNKLITDVEDYLAIQSIISV